MGTSGKPGPEGIEGARPAISRVQSHEASVPSRDRRVRGIFETLIRRASFEPKDTNLIGEMLRLDLPKFWAGALKAAQISPQETEAAVFKAIDSAMAELLRSGSYLEVVAELYNSLPRDTAALQETALEVAHQTLRAVEDRGRVEVDPVGYLALINNYAARLVQARRLSEALGDVDKAIDFGRQRFGPDSTAFADGLASALELRATILGAMHRRAEAVPPMEEALELYRRLAAERPQEYLRSLAICLNNRISMFDDLGRPLEAVESGREAATIFRSLLAPSEVATNYGPFPEPVLQAWISDVRADYATCLLALSTALNETGVKEETLEVVEESLSFLGPLAEDHPDQFRPMLGQAYNNRAMALGALDRNEDALAAMERAVSIFKDLARIRPDAYLHSLAFVLRGESLAFFKLGQIPQSVASCESAVEIYERLDRDHPSLFLPNLIKVLEQLEAIYLEVGQVEEAEKVSMRRKDIEGGIEASS